MLCQIHQAGSMGWNINFPVCVTGEKRRKEIIPTTVKAMLFPFSLGSSAKEQQFSVPIKALQEHTVETGCRGSIKSHTSFKYGLPYLPSALSCPR